MQRGLHAVDLQSARSAATQVASGDYSVIGGGGHNTASGNHATVGGGWLNTASGYIATVGGGELSNTASRQHMPPLAGAGSTPPAALMPPLAGAISNTASGNNATVGGGYQPDTASGQCMPPLAGAGPSNTASGDFATVGGGRENTASGNTASGDGATVGGGSSEHRQRRLQRYSWWILLASWCPQLWLQWADVADTNGPQRELEHCCLCGCGPVAVQPGPHTGKPASLLRAQAHGSGANYVACGHPRRFWQTPPTRCRRVHRLPPRRGYSRTIQER
jgi:hypothetical protein